MIASFYQVKNPPPPSPRKIRMIKLEGQSDSVMQGHYCKIITVTQIFISIFYKVSHFFLCDFSGCHVMVIKSELKMERTKKESA